MKIKLGLFIGLALAFFLCYPNNSLALSGNVWPESTEAAKQSNPITFTPQVGLPGFDQPYTFNENSTIPIATLMKEIYNYGIKIVGLLALITIIIGGFLWSMAGGNSQKVKEAQQWIFSGLGGVLLMLFAYLILRTINVNLVNFKIRDIKYLTGLNLIIPEKSNQEQAAGDQAFLDKYYAETIGENPNLEACCVYANYDFMNDKLKVASIAYTPENAGEAKNICLNHGNKWAKQDGESNGSSYYPDKEITENGKEQFFVVQDSQWKNNYSTNIEDLALFFITGSACWDLGGRVGRSSIGLDNPNYCKQVNNNGQACIYDYNGQKMWGFCEYDKCNRCYSYGLECNEDYQCPNRKKLIGSSTIVSGWQCGDSGIAGLTNYKATCDRTDHCECSIAECYEECTDNLRSTDSKLIENVCKSK